MRKILKSPSNIAMFRKHGKNISVSVENITPFGMWLFVNQKEYFLSYEVYPFFKEQPVGSILNVELHHGFHLFWPDLDVDLEIDNLEYPEKYPLKSNVKKDAQTPHASTL